MDSLDEVFVIGVIINKANNRYYLQLAGGKEIETDAQTAKDLIAKAKAEEIPISVMCLIPLSEASR
ncbi:MAG: hypothetical protein HPY81_06775 [Firmicutes bacterium]|nr:hypothetical protein [Bacillota bacterium]